MFLICIRNFGHFQCNNACHSSGLGTPSEGSSSVIDCARAKIMKNYKKIMKITKTLKIIAKHMKKYDIIRKHFFTLKQIKTHENKSKHIETTYSINPPSVAAA